MQPKPGEPGEPFSALFREAVAPWLRFPDPDPGRPEERKVPPHTHQAALWKLIKVHLERLGGLSWADPPGGPLLSCPRGGVSGMGQWLCPGSAPAILGMSSPGIAAEPGSQGYP